jgi:hypothetical protein
MNNTAEIKEILLKADNIAIVKEDSQTGDLFFVLPSDAISQVGWSEGDVLEWFDNGDGSWSVKKKHE